MLLKQLKTQVDRSIIIPRGQLVSSFQAAVQKIEVKNPQQKACLRLFSCTTIAITLFKMPAWRTIFQKQSETHRQSIKLKLSRPVSKLLTGSCAKDRVMKTPADGLLEVILSCHARSSLVQDILRQGRFYCVV